MPRYQGRKPDLTIDANVANDNNTPSNERINDVFLAISDAISRGYGNPEPYPDYVSESSSSSESDNSSNESDNDELLQAEFEKFYDIGIAKGYEEEEILEAFYYILENGTPDIEASSKPGCESPEPDRESNKITLPEFTRDNAFVKEIELRHLQHVFGPAISSTRQLVINRPERETNSKAVSPQNHIYQHDNLETASQITLKALSAGSTSSSEDDSYQDAFDSSDRPITPTASHVMLDTITGDTEVREPPNSTLEDENLVAWSEAGSSRWLATRPAWDDADNVRSTPQHNRWASSTTAGSGTCTNTRTISSSGLIPLLLPLRLEKRKERISETVATSANFSDRPISVDKPENTERDSSKTALEDKQSRLIDSPRIPSEYSIAYPDSPTLGYTDLSSHSTTVLDINTPTFSQFSQPSSSSGSTPVYRKMKIKRRSISSLGFRFNPRDIDLPSPSDTFSESNFSFRHRDLFSSIEIDEEAAYLAEKVSELRRDTNTEIVWRADTDPKKHPLHYRVWHSPNLRCTICPGFCNVCGAPCCAHFKATQTMCDSRASVEEKQEAWKLLKRFDQWCAHGIDVATFMLCNECDRKVCPGCCGVCPIYPCHDLICRDCKMDPWAPCIDGVHDTRTQTFVNSLPPRDRVPG